MKKLLTWLSKGSKIIKVLTYMYSGLYVIKSAIGAALAALKEQNPDADESKFKYLIQAMEYIATAIESIEMVLDWFGIDAKATLEEEKDAAKLEDKLDAEIAKLKELK